MRFMFSTLFVRGLRVDSSGAPGVPTRKTSGEPVRAWAANLYGPLFGKPSIRTNTKRAVNRLWTKYPQKTLATPS